MDVVPQARASDAGVSQAKVVVSVCAEVREEGGDDENATVRMNLAVSWIQRWLACTRPMALLVNQIERKHSI